jgi:phage terminase large subunit GpA-like protein
VVAFAETRESWVVEADYLDGDTDSSDSPVFEALRKRVVDHSFPDAFGRTRKCNAFGIDTGFSTNVTYSWVRSVQRMHPLTGQNVVFAPKGDKGWGKQALAFSGPQDIDLAGRKIRKGVALYRVGTWPLKSSFYAELEKLGVRSGQLVDPPGFVHLPQWVEENYVKQLVSETLSDEIFRGKRVQVWRLTPGMRDNHYLDCRIYNKALAEHIGLSKMSDEDWRGLARDRGAPEGAAPLWAAMAAAEEAPLAVDVAEHAAGDTSPGRARGISAEEIEQIQRAIGARGHEAARSWPPRRNVCPTN